MVNKVGILDEDLNAFSSSNPLPIKISNMNVFSSTYVPYNGATADLDLGTHSLSTTNINGNPVSNFEDAYTHSQLTSGNPHNVTQSDIGISSTGKFTDQSGGTSDTYGVLSGTIDGSNKTFTVSNSLYSSGSLVVYLNGQLLTQGTSEDWVEKTPSSGTFDFNTAPESGDEITVLYNDSASSIAQSASGISVTDTNNYYEGTNVEDVLAEIGETRHANGFDLQDSDSLPDLAWDDATRTFSCSVKSGQSSFHFWTDGHKHTKTSTQSVVIPDVTDTYYIYFDNSGNIQYVAYGSIPGALFYEYAIAGLVYWNKTSGKGMAGHELHGYRMSSRTHQFNHDTYGARYASGMDINGLADGSDVYTSVNSGVYWDEDIKHSVASHTNTPFIYRLGADGEWTGTTPDLKVSYNNGGTYDVWNEWDGSTWKLTEGTWNSDYWIIFMIATPDFASGYHYKKIIGQNAYSTRAKARNAIDSEKSKLITDGLPSPEFVFMFAWIVKRNGDLEDDGDGNTYYDLRTEKGGGAGTSTQASLASDVVTDTTNFNGLLSSTDTDVQTALETIDDYDALPAGNDTEVQFNDGGVLAGDANFTFDKTTGVLGVDTRIEFGGHGHSIYMGYNAGRYDDGGNYNVGIGYNSLQAVTSGNYNYGIGAYTGRVISSGSNNIAIGYASMYFATTSSSNTCVGHLAGYKLSTGTGSNTLIGYNSGIAMTTGYYNVAIGGAALKSLTTNGYCTAIGTEAAYLVTGYDNMAIGAASLHSCTTGIRNMALGTNALNKCTGSYNSGIGGRALYNATTGSSNVGIGYNTGSQITTGTQNTIIGSNITTGLSTTTSNHVILGDGAGTIRFFCDNNGNIGLSSITSPTARLHLPACTASANTASLKIDSGTLATTPVSGNIESDGTHIYWTDSSGTRKQLD